MKTSNFLFVLLLSLIFTGCQSVGPFYQIYKTMPDAKTTVKGSSLVFEDNNCSVIYDLWDESGDIGFVFYNQTDKNIYINKEESFFVMNGIANNYYKGRIYTSTKNSTVSNSNLTSSSKAVTGVNIFDLLQSNQTGSTRTSGIQTSAGYSISYNEEKTICVPPKSSKLISEYTITSSIYRDCDLFRYPVKKQIIAKSFTRENSPYVFSNRIKYTVGVGGTEQTVENNFYVKEITNYPEKEIVSTSTEEFCKQKGLRTEKTFKLSGPDKFYVKYYKGGDSWRH